MADHGFFHLQCGVFGHGQVAGHQGAVMAAPRAGPAAAWTGVDVDEHDLDRGHVGLVAGCDLGDAVEQDFEAPGRSPSASVVVRIAPLAT